MYPSKPLTLFQQLPVSSFKHDSVYKNRKDNVESGDYCPNFAKVFIEY
jgi:hypothetical protein